MRELLYTEQLEQATEVLSTLLLYNIAFDGIALNGEEQERLLKMCRTLTVTLERLKAATSFY